MYPLSKYAGRACVIEIRARRRAQHLLLFFDDQSVPRLDIRVDGFDRIGDIAYEWGSFRIGESTGCYVRLRRDVDDWKIYREWIAELAPRNKHLKACHKNSITYTNYRQ